MTIVTVLGLLLAGFVYQLVSVKYEVKKYQPVGQMIEVEGHKMHIYAKGQGSPTVVMTVGLGSPSAVVDYYRVLEGLSHYTRAVVYERPGYGWSEKTNTSRTVEQMTKELYLLLEKSGETPPYVLVGHSMGSLEILHFAQTYPGLVAGVVLVDGGSPEYYRTVKFSAAFKAVIYGTRLVTRLGLIRLFGNAATILGISTMAYFPKDMRNKAKAKFYSNWFNDNSIQELKQLKRNAAIVESYGPIGDIPLVLLSSEKSIKGVTGWDKTQKKLLIWSGNSRREVIQGTSHSMHFNNPEAIVKEIVQAVSHNRQ
ncbi:alpha/beta hydrolase [Desulfitobacterium chlororespirans]|uniref:Pimeloyl-ACP methyl ester carboxylesterase n=1 Tax=Desulfitobacterium chlororespirans DSM 11544 TaxID=1121395 RepID=A0A1M7UM67_9FIRM|nr:alpha/beta hydrolase [Desulfitobacterium chlororespirans]SHN83996.1 Pimeloyl-ACP methyl ester carboxylesterase [Desulfitobacterium chlororespirans DSM 11544]